MKMYAIISLVVAALLLSGCCGCNIPFPTGGATGAIIDGIHAKVSGNPVANGGTTTERVQTISGTVLNPAGNATTFGGKVRVVLNGESQYVTPYQSSGANWTYSGNFVLQPGTNTMQTIVEDENGNPVYTSDTYTVIGNLPARAIEVVLTWTTDENDVDLHILAPNGQEANYTRLTGITGCNLDLDDTDGYGPETFVCENTTFSGPWNVYVRYYNDHGVTENVPTNVTVRINEGARQTYNHIFTQEQADYNDPTNDWNVTTFQMQ